MSRILAIDYGKKRVGLAWTDILQITVNPLDTMPPEKLFAWLSANIPTEKIQTVVVGMPLDAQGKDTDSTKEVRHFLVAFRNKFPGVKLVTEDESFSSKEAVSYMVTQEWKKKDRQKKENIDKVSAAIILQRYMDRLGI